MVWQSFTSYFVVRVDVSVFHHSAVQAVGSEPCSERSFASLIDFTQFNVINLFFAPRMWEAAHDRRSDKAHSGRRGSVSGRLAVLGSYPGRSWRGILLCWRTYRWPVGVNGRTLRWEVSVLRMHDVKVPHLGLLYTYTLFIHLKLIYLRRYSCVKALL